jgi:tetratricopeptide (TPR) repeat protein
VLGSSQGRRGGVAGFALWLGLAALALDMVAVGPRALAEDGTVGSGIKAGLGKLGKVFSPSPAPQPEIPESDAISLKNQAKPGPELYVAFARLHEQQGRIAEAEAQYKKALSEEPDDLQALLGYAMLKQRAGQWDAAIALYQQAAKAHPSEASVMNNLGLCYAQSKRPDEAVSALGRAVQLQPKNALYRNNLATVLVDQGQKREAFMHLRAVHGDAAAYYNLGYLLNKKGETEAAAQHFAMALRLNPQLSQARQWLERLQPSVAASPGAGRPAGSQPVRVGSRLADSGTAVISDGPENRGAIGPGPSGSAALPSLPEPGNEPIRRLPPIQVRPSDTSGAAPMPPSSSPRAWVPAAPMPPDGAQGSSAGRRLPWAR